MKWLLLVERRLLVWFSWDPISASMRDYFAKHRGACVFQPEETDLHEYRTQLLRSLGLHRPRTETPNDEKLVYRL